MNCCSVDNILDSPKGSFGLLVHPPDVIVLDWEEDEKVRIIWRSGWGAR